MFGLKKGHLYRSPETGKRYFSTIFDNVRHNSMIFDINQQYLTLFNIIWQYSTILDNFDIIRHFSTVKNVEKCCGSQFLLLNFVVDVEKCRGPVWGVDLFMRGSKI